MDVRLIDATAEDLGLIAQWVCAMHVRLWWGEPEEVYGELEDEIPGPGYAVIAVDGRKVGLVVYSRPSREELDDAGLADIPSESVDLDMMIGEPDCVGKGIGRRAMQLAAERIFEDPSVPLIIAATSASNAGAIEAAKKAGFDTAREFDDGQGGRYVLAVKRRA